jgi:hypothetical protein
MAFDEPRHILWENYLRQNAHFKYQRERASSAVLESFPRPPSLDNPNPVPLTICQQMIDQYPHFVTVDQHSISSNLVNSNVGQPC